MLSICCQPEYQSLPPLQIVPRLADQTSFTASGPNQLWSWDISYCPSAVRGEHWYLYLILDVYSRKIIAWEVYDSESGDLAKQLVERALLRERCWHTPPVLHADNGAPMISYTLRARLAALGMLMSHRRPQVSNDNPYLRGAVPHRQILPGVANKGLYLVGRRA